MKKFYSIVLMAVALLVGTNVNAEEVATWDDLSSAISAAVAGTPTTITLTADIAMPASGQIAAIDGKILVLDLNEHDITYTGSTTYYPIYVENGQMTIKGNGTISSTYYAVAQVKGSNTDVPNYSILNVENGVNMVSEGSYGFVVAQGPKVYNSKGKLVNSTHGYGIVVNFDGYVEAKGAEATAFWVLGNIKDTSGNIPQITIGPNAVLVGTTDGVGYYAGGYAVTEIQGAISGGAGIYAKAGDITISGDAVITATATVYEAPAANGNGFTGGMGCAIVSDTNKGYKGEMEITITGNATITTEANDGYSLKEVVTNANQSSTESIVIESGTINGDLSVTAEVKENIVVNGTITGGTFDSDVTEYLSNITGVITPIVNETTGKTEYVIESKPIGSPDWIADITAADANSWVRLENGGTVTLNADAQAHYLVMQGVDKIIINDGVSLIVDEVVLGADAVIDVQLGGRLVVKGAQGIVAKSTKNILIAAKEGQMGTFLQSPAVTSNMNPSATVTLETKAHMEGSNYIYQRIGVPAVDGIKVSEMKANPASASIALAYWGDAEQDWVWVPNTSFVLQPFQGLALTNQATTEGTKYTMPCRLMGNSDISLPVVGDWTSFANSYMANIDLFELLSDVLADNTISASAYVYVAADDRWYPISYGKLESWKNGGAEPKATELEPMQGFIFNNYDALPNVSVAVSYEDHVWDPVFDVNHATPKGIVRRGVGSNTTSVQINIVAENGLADEITLTQSEDFSAAFDNGYDMKAMRGINPVSIFATSELGDMAELASDNIIGTKLNVATNDETMFKMTFSNLRGEQLAIRDNVTGSTITMAEGAEYFFTVAENSVNERFEIVNIKNAPTDVELIQVTEGAKAVYTIMGQYVGTTEKWNVLPAGIYVVDGVKMVK